MPTPLILIRLGSGISAVPQPGKVTLSDSLFSSTAIEDELVAGAGTSDAAVGIVTIEDDP